LVDQKRWKEGKEKQRSKLPTTLIRETTQEDYEREITAAIVREARRCESLIPMPVPGKTSTTAPGASRLLSEIK